MRNKRNGRGLLALLLVAAVAGASACAQLGLSGGLSEEAKPRTVEERYLAAVHDYAALVRYAEGWIEAADAQVAAGDPNGDAYLAVAERIAQVSERGRVLVERTNEALNGGSATDDQLAQAAILLGALLDELSAEVLSAPPVGR